MKSHFEVPEPIRRIEVKLAPLKSQTKLFPGPLGPLPPGVRVNGRTTPSTVRRT